MGVDGEDFPRLEGRFPANSSKVSQVYREVYGHLKGVSKRMSF